MSGVGEGDNTVLEVMYRDRKEDIENDQTRSEELDQELAQVDVELDELRALLNRVKKEDDFVVQYAKSITDVNTKNARDVSQLTDEATLENVTQFMEFYGNQVSKNQSRVIEVENQIEEAVKRRMKIKEERDKQKPPVTKATYREVCILVQSSEPGEAVFLVTYMVYNASWTASYDIRVSSADNSISLTYYGVIQQNTREHWKDVMLSLSTATPNNRNDPPTLNGMVLKYVVHQSYNHFAKRSKAKGSILGGFGGAMPSLSASSNSSSVEQASVEQGSTSSSFTINKLSTIASDNQKHKVVIGVINLSDITYSYSSVPKKEPIAYLKVSAVNASPYSFLAGPMNVFFDNNFATSTQMNPVNAGEEFESFLGKDPAVKVTYDPPSKFRETKGLLRGTSESTVKRRIIIRNKKSIPIKVAVTDQFPTSYDSRITIQAITPKIATEETQENVPILFGEQFEPNKRNADKLTNSYDSVLEWTFNMNPGDTVAVPIEYTVSWPTGYSVNDI